MRSSTTSSGTDSAPSAARGMGMSSGNGTQGAPHSAASRASSPPCATASTWPPAARASCTASRVSSVLPENETAMTSVERSTNDGGS